MTDITTRQQQGSPAAMLTAYVDDFATVLPSTGVNAATFVRRAQGLLRRDRQLAQIATRNPGSFFSALLDCASLGHEPGSGAYHLVAFGNEITGIEDYKGKIDRVYRAGAVTSIKAEIVYANDRFAFNPSRDARPSHEIDWDAEDRGDVRLAYAFAEMKDGTTSRVVVMNKAQIDKHRKESRGSDKASSPWVKWYESMAIKTVVHELEKWVPSSAEYREEMAKARAAADQIAAVGQVAGVTPQSLEAAADHNDRYDEPRDDEPGDEVNGSVDVATGEVYADFVEGDPTEEAPW